MVTAVQLRNATRDILRPVIQEWNAEIEDRRLNDENHPEGTLLEIIAQQCARRWPDDIETQHTVRDYLIERLIEDNTNNTIAGVRGAINELQHEVRSRLIMNTLMRLNPIGSAWASDDPSIREASQFLASYNPEAERAAELARINAAVRERDQQLALTPEFARDLARIQRLSGSEVDSDVARYLEMLEKVESVRISAPIRSDQQPEPDTQPTRQVEPGTVSIVELQRELERHGFETGRLGTDGSVILAYGRTDDGFDGVATRAARREAWRMLAESGVTVTEADRDNDALLLAQLSDRAPLRESPVRGT